MVTAQEIAEFLASDEYENALQWHVDRGCRVSMAPGSVEFVRKAVEVSACSMPELAECLRLHGAAFRQYVSGKLSRYEGVVEEQHPPGETPPRDDKPKIIAIRDKPRDFLLVHLVEFAIMQSRIDAIEDYVKQRRIPNAKQYAKEIQQIFRRSQPNR